MPTIAKQNIMSSNSNNNMCPVCGREFSPLVISEHVNSCLNKNTETSDRQSRKRKISEWDFLTKSQKADVKITAQSAKVAKPALIKGKPKVGSAQMKTVKLDTGPKPDIADDEDDDSDVEFVKYSEVNGRDQKNLNINTKVTSAEGGNNQNESTYMELQHVSNKTVADARKDKDVESSSQSVNTMFFKQKAKSTGNASFGRNVPLAERVRPTTFDNFMGQAQAVGKKSLLHTLLTRGENIPSMVLWGPPGCGKTTLAKIIAQKCKEQGNIKFITMSATSASVSDVKETAKVARNDLKMFRRKTIVFLDEIHRFNKAQQDVLLPHVEDGTITLIGATTENPSFYVNGALLSRCRVITLEKLKIDDIKAIIKRALQEMGVTLTGENCGDAAEKTLEKSSDLDARLFSSVVMDTEALDVLAGLVDGDARTALNGLQLAVEGSVVKHQQQQQDEEDVSSEVVITVDLVKEALQRSHVLYDKTGEEHYNTVSALIKSMRGSDASAALYWMTRMLEGGENPLFVARRLVVFASEDVGLADPMALNLAVATHQACHFIGMPECALNLAHCVIYLSRAPKSTEVLQGLQAARDCIKNHEGALPPVPLHLRNAPTKLMKSLGYGKDYKYPPNFDGPVKQDYFPACLSGTDFFSKSTSTDDPT